MEWGKKPQEKKAALIAAEHLGGTPHRRDCGGANGVHDYDIQIAERKIALEVTSWVDSKALAALNAGPPVIDGLSAQWRVTIDHTTAKVTLLKTPLSSVLLDLEAQGVDEHVPTTSEDPYELKSIGVAGLFQEADGTPGVLTIDLAPRFETVNADEANVIVSEVANLADNVTKLMSADADERHLFIWCHHLKVEPLLAFNPECALPGQSHLPVDATVLPDYLDMVWLCAEVPPHMFVTLDSTNGWTGPMTGG